MPPKDAQPPTTQMRLLGAHGLTAFILTVKELSETRAEIEVVRVCSWDSGSNEPGDLEPYFEATIKWDGCSHVFFGGVDGGKRDDYLHLCGVNEWKEHARVMEWAYRETTKLISAMESDEMWGEA